MDNAAGEATNGMGLLIGDDVLKPIRKKTHVFFMQCNSIYAIYSPLLLAYSLGGITKWGNGTKILKSTDMKKEEKNFDNCR